MKILLINPEYPDTYWSFRHALPFEGRRSAFPPLGLLTVSALLPRAWKRRLVDLNVRRLKDSHIEWADVVFCTAMLVQKDSLREVVKRCKARGKRVVIAGPYVQTSEAETTLPASARDLERGCARRLSKAEDKPALTLTPVPAFRLAELGRYSAM